MASTSIPGCTSKGMLWMVSPSMHAASATFSSSSRPTPWEPYVFQGDRKSDLQADVHDLLNYLGRALLEHEHGDHPEGYLFPVPVMMGALQSGEAIVDGV